MSKWLLKTITVSRMNTEKPALITKQNINNFKRFADMNVSVVVCAQKVNEYENTEYKLLWCQHGKLKSIKCIKVVVFFFAYDIFSKSIIVSCAGNGIGLAFILIVIETKYIAVLVKRKRMIEWERRIPSIYYHLNTYIHYSVKFINGVNR